VIQRQIVELVADASVVAMAVEVAVAPGCGLSGLAGERLPLAGVLGSLLVADPLVDLFATVAAATVVSGELSAELAGEAEARAARLHRRSNIPDRTSDAVGRDSRSQRIAAKILSGRTA